MPNSNGSDSQINSQPNRQDGGRVPPQAVEVEEAVLGAMLIEREAATIALQLLKPDDFYKPANRHIFETLFDLYERGNPLDLLTIENELRDKNLLDTVGGTGYLADLTRSVSSAANIDYHSQIISEKAIKRNLILNCNEIIKSAYDTTTDANDVLDGAEQRIFEIANTKSRAQATAIGDILKDTLGYLEELRGKPEGVTGVPSNLDVDRYTSGWQRGDLIIIAARPSMGKTAFTLTAARNAALHPNENLQTNVAIFSLEMSAQQLVQRFLTMEARVDAQSARTGKVKDEDFKRLIDAASRLFTAKIFIDDTPSLSLMELRTKCRRLKSEHDIGLVVVDYLQLMTASSRDIGNREQEIATISRGLKSLAKELDVPVIALSQLSRQVEQRGGDKRPQLSDLRESGSIEQDADVVCFLYRPEYYGITTTPEGESTNGLAELIIGKQRNGPVGSTRMFFVKEYARFERLSRVESGPGGNDFLNEPAESNAALPPPPPHSPGGDDEAPF
ncbi:MAG: replicative DNA helicase [Balneolaceae bacterium]|nr:MAG: replicative DNA helicase [Balneolaceae bacterium]